MSAAPGWYPDPNDPSRTRWWDGTSWAPESRPAESRPAESRPAESRPAESRPAESRPAESRPAESRPTGSAVGVGMDRAAVQKRSGIAAGIGLGLMIVAGLVLYSQFETWNPDGGVLTLGWILGVVGYLLLQAGVVGWVVTAGTRTAATG